MPKLGLLQWLIKETSTLSGFLVSKETVLLRRWKSGSNCWRVKQNFGFIWRCMSNSIGPYCIHDLNFPYLIKENIVVEKSAHHLLETGPLEHS